jgi:homoserine O-acetyltransferase
MTEAGSEAGAPVERGVRSVGRFEFDCGESVPDLELAYEAHGEYDGDNAVLVCHALTGSHHVATGGDGSDDGGEDGTAGQARAWWDAVVGPGGYVDTTDHYVVCVNVPGSCYGSTGPASVDPATGDPYGADFPPVTVPDWTRAQRRLLDELGVDRLRAVVGGSVGGMNALDWAKRYPGDVDRVGAVATAPRLDPQCLALDAVARRAIRADPNWAGGDYYGGPRPTEGLAIARQLGHVTYLSKASMARKFGRRPAGEETGDAFPADPAGDYFPYRDVESYLDYQSEKFVGRFDANSYLYLTRAMDDYDLATGRGSDAAALSRFDGELLVLSFTGDWHFTVEDAEDLAASAREAGVRVVHHTVDSDHGHDAFLVEPDAVGPPLSALLEDGLSGSVRGEADPVRTGDTARAPVHTSLFPG